MKYVLFILFSISGLEGFSQLRQAAPVTNDWAVGKNLYIPFGAGKPTSAPPDSIRAAFYKDIVSKYLYTWNPNTHVWDTAGGVAAPFDTTVYNIHSTGFNDGRYVRLADGSYVKTVVLNTPGVIFTNPVNFATSGNTATGTLTLNNQSANTIFGNNTASSVTPSFNVASSYADAILGGTSNGYLKRTGANTYSNVAAIPNTDLANSTISGISLGGTLNNLTATDNTLTFSGSYNGSTARTVGLNLANTNTWTGKQQFSASTPYTPGSYPSVYSTSDTTTNFGRLSTKFVSGNPYLLFEKGGTVTTPNMYISNGISTIFLYGGLNGLNAANVFSGTVYSNDYKSSGGGNTLVLQNSVPFTAADNDAVNILPTVNTTGNMQGLTIAYYEQQTPSTTSFPFRIGRRSAAGGLGTYTSLLDIDRLGVFRFMGNAPTTGQFPYYNGTSMAWTTPTTLNGSGIVGQNGTSTVYNSLVTNSIPFATNAYTLATTNNLSWDNTNNKLTAGQQIDIAQTSTTPTPAVGHVVFWMDSSSGSVKVTKNVGGTTTTAVIY